MNKAPVVSWISSKEVDTMIRVQIFDDAFHIFRKGMNPIIIFPSIGKIIGQTGLCSLVSATSLSKSKVGDLSRGWSEGSLFDSYYTKV